MAGGETNAAKTPAELTPADLKKQVDDVLLDVLEQLGFFRNMWHFHPSQVRKLLGVLSYGLFALAVWSFSHRGRSRYTFLGFGLVLYALYWYWYEKIESGGGIFMFSPDWRDSFIRTRVTKTNYVLDIRVGYELDLKASLPLSGIAAHADPIDEEWLADEINEQFHHMWK